MPAYECQAVVARTDGSLVLHATDTTTGQAVAIKMGERERVQREARLLRMFDHPHVTPCLDQVGTNEPALVLPLAACSLADRHAAQPLTPDEIGTVVLAIATALEHVHLLGVAHRDLKAANILLCADGHPLLADFGEASEASRASEQQLDTDALRTIGLELLGERDVLLANLLRRPATARELAAALVAYGGGRWPEPGGGERGGELGAPTRRYGPPRPAATPAPDPTRPDKKSAALVAAAAVVISAVLWIAPRPHAVGCEAPQVCQPVERAAAQVVGAR